MFETLSRSSLQRLQAAAACACLHWLPNLHLRTIRRWRNVKIHLKALLPRQRRRRREVAPACLLVNAPHTFSFLGRGGLTGNDKEGKFSRTLSLRVLALSRATLSCSAVSFLTLISDPISAATPRLRHANPLAKSHLQSGAHLPAPGASPQFAHMTADLTKKLTSSFPRDKDWLFPKMSFHNIVKKYKRCFTKDCRPAQRNK